MPQKVIAIKDREYGCIYQVFCSRECADNQKSPSDLEVKVNLPILNKGITGLAVALLCCSNCGNNLADTLPFGAD